MQYCKPILLVEDDRLTTMAFKSAIDELKVLNQLVHITDAEEALEYLKKSDSKKPCIIILDFNMAKTNGVEFVRTVKSSGTVKKIPIIVITTWAKEQRAIETLDLDITGFLTKPIDYKNLVEAVRTTDLCWILTDSQTQSNGR
jgi:DNA-binding NarL/FixJ family response regulator